MLLLTLGTAIAGPCEGHVLFTKGASMTVAHYDPKGKPTSTVVTENRDVKGDVAVLHGQMTDKKGKDLAVVDYEVKCGEGGSMSIDMRAFVSPASLEAFRNYEITFESTDLVFPGALSAGQSLDDATLNATMRLPDAPAAIGTVHFDVVIRDRRVVGSESVTVPAGTFDAWKIASTSDLSTRGIVKTSFETSSIEWYVPGLGVVRSESTRPNGKSAGHSEMTRLSR